jgi:hypothetical protein
LIRRARHLVAGERLLGFQPRLWEEAAGIEPAERSAVVVADTDLLIAISTVTAAFGGLAAPQVLA